jgi:hypothetical protein
MNGRGTSPIDGGSSGEAITGGLVEEFESGYPQEINIISYDQDVLKKLSDLNVKVEGLTKRTEKLETVLNISEIKKEDFEEPSTWNKEKAKEEILKLFSHEKEAGYSDIIERLGIDLNLIIEICEELETEKKIESIK